MTNLNNCTSIDQVVDLINEDTLTLLEREEVAAKYALNAAEEAGYGVEKREIEAHLDCLVEAGAEFNYIKAVSLAIK